MDDWRAEKRSAKTGALLKRYGLKPGMPDFIIWWHGKSYGIELKAQGGRVSPAQHTTLNRLRDAGVEICIVYRIEAIDHFLRAAGMKLRVRG